MIERWGCKTRDRAEELVRESRAAGRIKSAGPSEAVARPTPEFTARPPAPTIGRLRARAQEIRVRLLIEGASERAQAELRLRRQLEALAALGPDAHYCDWDLPWREYARARRLGFPAKD